MTKSELISKLAAQNPNLYMRDIETIVETIIEEMSSTLERGDRIELRGFGAFSVKERAPRVGRKLRDELQVGDAQRLVLQRRLCVCDRRLPRVDFIPLVERRRLQVVPLFVRLRHRLLLRHPLKLLLQQRARLLHAVAAWR